MLKQKSLLNHVFAGVLVLAPMAGRAQVEPEPSFLDRAKVKISALFTRKIGKRQDSEHTTIQETTQN